LIKKNPTETGISRSGGHKSSTAGELHVQTDIQAPNMEDDGRGGDNDEGNDFRLTPSGDTSLNSGGSASLSFSSDTDYLSDTYGTLRRPRPRDTGFYGPRGPR
jgi:hypothetical protein